MTPSTETYGIVTQAPGHAGVHSVIRVVQAGRRITLGPAEALVDGIPTSVEGFGWRKGMLLPDPPPMRSGPGTFTVR